jgi:hypothetical protein
MHSRALRLAVLLFQALWLNVIVPGHQRGIVAMPGWSCEACEKQATQPDSSCCAIRNARQANEPAGRPPVHGDPARHCAICHFAAHLSLPPELDLSLSRLFLAETSLPPAGESIGGRDFFATYDGRGPPAMLPHIT